MRWVTTSSRNRSTSSFCLVSADAIVEGIGTALTKIMHSSLFVKTVGQPPKAEQTEKQG